MMSRLGYLKRLISKLGRFEEALSDLNTAIVLKPGRSGSYNLQSDAHLRLGQLDAALADIEKVLELKNYNSSSWHGLHRICDARKDWQPALEAYEDFFRQEPPNADVIWESYVVALVASGQHGKYREFCGKLIEQYGQTDDPDLARNVIKCLVTGEDAVDDWSVPLRLGDLLLASEKPKRLIGLLMRAGEYQRAIQSSREANQEAGGKLKSIPCLWTGLAHHGLGELDEAKRMLSQAKEREAESPYATARVVYQMLYRELADLVGEEFHEPTEQ